MRTRLVLIATLLTAVLAACGGGGSKSSTTTSAPTTATSAPSTATGSDPAAIARAQKLVLTQADFPAGWTGTPTPPDTPETKAARQELFTCAGLSTEEAQSGEVKGDAFSMGSPATQATADARIIKDEATYKKDVDALKNSKFQSCLQNYLTKVLSAATGSATPTNVQVTPLTTETFGDVTVGIRMSAAITVQGQTLTIVLDGVVMGKNKAEVQSAFTNLAQPFDQALEKSLIAKLGAKLDANS